MSTGRSGSCSQAATAARWTAVITAGSESEFQVLVMLEPRDAVCDQLRQYLRHVIAGKRSDMCTKQAEHLKRMWQLLTPPGTQLRMELERYQEDPEDYEPPLREPWGRLLGSAYVLRSHPEAQQQGSAAQPQPPQDGQQPQPHPHPQQPRDTVPELLFAGDVVRLCLPPGNKDAWEFDDDTRELLSELCEQDMTNAGPWRFLLLEAAMAAEDSPEVLREAREAFLLCLHRLQIFAPSELYNTLNLEMVDPIGFDDGNARRLVLQRQVEAASDNVILLLERDLGSMGPVMAHLANSPFMRKWVAARLHPDPGQAKPNLSIMYFREKSGHIVPKRGQAGYAGRAYEGGEQIRLPYLQHLGSAGTNYLRPQLTNLANKSRADIGTLLEQFVRNHSDGPAESAAGVMKRVQRLVSEVPVFYALPLLGQAISRELEAAAAQLEDGERAAAAAAAGAAGGSSGGRGGAAGCRGRGRGLAGAGGSASAGTGSGGGGSGGGPLQRATDVPQEQLAAALDDTNLHELLGTLAQPQVKAVIAALVPCIDACNKALAEVHDTRCAVAELSGAVPELNKLNLKFKKSETIKVVMEGQVGDDSTFKEKVMKSFSDLEKTTLSARLCQLLSVEIKPMLQQAADCVAERIIRKFKLQGSGSAAAAPQLQTLLQAVAPSTDWLHKEAPIKGWLQVEFMKRVKFDGIRAILEDVIGQVQRISKELMVNLLMEYAPLERDAAQETRNSLRAFYDGRLEKWFKFSDTVHAAMLTEFFRGRRAMPVAEYSRLPGEVLESARSSHIMYNLKRGLYKAVHAAANNKKTPESQLGPEVARAVRAWFSNRFMAIFLNQKKHGLEQQLHDCVFHKLTEVRCRLYDNGLAANAKDTGLLHRKWGTLFLKSYKQIYFNVLEEDLTPGSAEALEAEEAELKELKTRLAQMAEPRELAKLLPPRMGRLLGRALVVAKARMVQTGASGLERAGPLLAKLRPAGAAAAGAAQQQRRGNGGGGASQTQAALARAGGGSAGDRGSGSRGNGAGGAAAMPTSAQVAAFKAHLERSGLELVDCPAADNNGGYFAVLSQVQGTRLSASDEAAAALVSDWRGMVAAALEHHVAVEAAAPTGPRPWMDAICALAQPQQAAAGAAAGAPAAAVAGAAAEEVVRQHLGRVRRDAPMTHVELVVLSQLLEDSSVVLSVYSPAYEARRGYCVVLNDAAPVHATHVRLAAGGAVGAGELYHWNVVQPRGGRRGQAAPAAAAADERRGLQPAAAGRLQTPPTTRQQTRPAAAADEPDEPGAPNAKRPRRSCNP
ncbi:hypothetical protein HXX76_008401 [Chlamydomonas incerta]|uniref:Uncharacterized protein n=1 Tax=Chlamydomonas incerta TaxID=51695 RepID=A0A835SXK9_CHLIN|nr:hypothetical protein HXX76_008401 [Chlamydomonas incerta]|eukprot:KAG2433337.1 hypothetical protein HXX76_008401 [Chlamydomonas incerta]